MAQRCGVNHRVGLFGVRRTPERRPMVAPVFLMLMLVLAGCVPTAWPSVEASQLPRLIARDSTWTLRGDPGFDLRTLPDDRRVWHGAFVDDVEVPHGGFDALALAASDDTYGYGRTLHVYVQAVLAVFRMTGDLRLLDHVDEIAEVMRAQLRDGWRGTRDGSDGTRDGYLNWVYRYVDDESHVGKDTHVMNDMMAHAMVAMIAYALHENRGVPSPSGRDYAAHADFWTDYLVNHFEAKWRERNGRPSGSFPIMIHSLTHSYISWLKWHYYMGEITGRADYSDEATRMADVFWDEIRAAPSPRGPAYVWAHSMEAEGGSHLRLHPTTYARYVFNDFVDFHLEGFHRWASDEEMAKFARTVAWFVMDADEGAHLELTSFASDVGGGTSRAGLQSASGSRLSFDRFAFSSFGLTAAWDTSGRVASVTRSVRDDAGSERPRVVLTASVLIDTWLRDRSAGPATVAQNNGNAP